MIEARSYTRENYPPPPPPRPQTILRMAQARSYTRKNCRICTGAVNGFGNSRGVHTSSQFVNHFTSGSGAFLYPQNYWKSCDQPAAGDFFWDSLVFLEQILKFFITHRSAYKKYEILKLLKTSKNIILGPPQANFFWDPKSIFFKKPPYSREGGFLNLNSPDLLDIPHDNRNQTCLPASGR